MSTAYVSVSALAARLSVSRQQIYTAIKNGQLPHVRIGRAIRVSESAATLWIANGGRTATTGKVTRNPESVLPAQAPDMKGAASASLVGSGVRDECPALSMGRTILRPALPEGSPGPRSRGTIER